MSQDRFTLESVEAEVKRFRLTPEEARRRLLEVRAIIDGFLEPQTDAQRIILYRRFMEVLGWASPEHLLFWSKIADTSSK